MRILTSMLFAAASLAAQNSATPSAAPPVAPPAHPAVKATKKAQALTSIPKDAVETMPGVYSWTDKDGKAWMYRRTPFGVSRWPAEPMYTKQDAADEQTTAKAEGDSIRFERSTPFGKRTWVRKKSEMNDTEKAIWENQQKNSAASRAAEKE